MKERKEFWDTQHILKNIDTLSGSKFQINVDFFKLNDIINPKMKVLEVGVGLGYATKEWFDNGYVISAVDISEIALANVKDFCENTYTVDELHLMETNYFDIIICVNLIQHIPTDMLKIELKELLRTLKNDGIFALQFVGTGVDDGGHNSSFNGFEGCYGRTPKFMEELIEELGGKIKLIHNESISIGPVIGNYAFHVTKK